MSQVLIVSNRLPVSVKKEDGELKFYPSTGGLATGLSSYVNDRNNTWIGWPGIASDDLNDGEKQLIVSELAKHSCSPIFLKQKQIDEFYNGYSNDVLWPAFHNLRHKAKTGELRTRWWQSYRNVNRQYADAVLNLSEQGGRIWVHDYQLMLVPEMLREGRSGITIGFFLHIPFPDIKTFAKVKESKKLLAGVLGADLVGFHTTSYVENFVDNCQANGIGSVSAGQLLVGERLIRVGNFPMGIDYAKYAGSKSKETKMAIRKYRKKYKGRKIIVAVDRLDPSKGLVERLKAYRMFLEEYPKRRGKVIFSMVAAPSRVDVPAYKNLSKRLDALVKEINDEFGTPKWQPVDYINTTLPFEEVTALFQIADVAFIAPLKDGMNLAAKEFVASAHKDGVLILSETAGASEELPDALIVNPKRPKTLVEALNKALTMRRRELRRRLRNMQQQLSTHTVQAWAKDFVSTLQQPVPGNMTITRTLRQRLQKNLVTDYHTSRKRLLLLDYDGSLVPFNADYRAATPPKSLIKLLEELSADKANDIVVISGRGPQDLEKWFDSLPISLVAEHGAAVRKAGNKIWRMIEKKGVNWQKILLPVLEKYAGLAPGARVEVKPHSLVWHYRGASPYYAQKYAVTLRRVLKPVLKSYGLELLQGNKALEIKNPKISKGEAAAPWLKRDYGFVMAIGDDVTDEDLFAVLPLSANSIKVGRGRTAARFRITSHKDTLRLLKNLAKPTASGKRDKGVFPGLPRGF